LYFYPNKFIQKPKTQMMKKIFSLLLISLLIISCSKKSDTATSEFSNNLTLGTGLSSTNSFELAGTGTSFATSDIIYFRLESVDDMAGSKVRIKITKQDGTEFESPADFDNPQTYGHIFISAFQAPSVAGTYTATGILVTGNKTIASLALTIH
jgi:hypothetical protein